VLEFLALLNLLKIPTTLRQVIIPTLNDNADNILRLRDIAKRHPCVDKIELLPFKKMCKVKYDNLGIPFRFGHLPEPTTEEISALEELLK
jgi:pyruvate formate lyase activating enzyme